MRSSSSSSHQDVTSCTYTLHDPAQLTNKHLPATKSTTTGQKTSLLSTVYLRGNCEEEVVWEQSAYIFKLFNVVVGEDISFLEINIRIQRLSYQSLPEWGQEVEWQGNICSNCNAQKLPKEMEQLLLCIGYGARCQNVLPLQRNRTEHTNQYLKTDLYWGVHKLTLFWEHQFEKDEYYWSGYKKFCSRMAWRLFITQWHDITFL